MKETKINVSKDIEDCHKKINFVRSGHPKKMKPSSNLSENMKKPLAALRDPGLKKRKGNKIKIKIIIIV